MKMHKVFLWALACTWSVGALAQWQWTDKDGRKVFSDRPPSADVPPARILKQPHGQPLLVVTPVAADEVAKKPADAGAASSAKAATPPTAAADSGTDKELEEKKAKATAAEAAKKKAEDAKRAAARADNCSRAQRAKAAFDAERPVRQTSAQGEIVILEGKERAAEVRRIQSIVDADCKR
jgi:hypothetical protein